MNTLFEMLLMNIELTDLACRSKRRLPSGTLIIEQEMVHGFDGPNLLKREWRIVSECAIEVSLEGEIVNIVSGPFSGRCRLYTLSDGVVILQGMGELIGMNVESLHDKQIRISRRDNN